MKISEIKELKEKTTVDTMSGMVENVYERHAGTKEGRAWSMQNIMLKDASGAVKVLLSGRKECPKSMEGKQVSFSSVNGEKGLTGMYVKDDKYKGKTTRVVIVTEVATVKVVGGSNGESTKSSAAPASKQMVLGQTVGMAINNAVHILTNSAGNRLEYYSGDDFIYDLHAIASSVIYVSKALESGEPLKRPQEPTARQETPKQEESSSETDANFLSGDEVNHGPF